MKPLRATIPLYANNEKEVADFEKAFYDFVSDKQKQGIAVSAKKMTQALKMFGDNKYLINFLKV